MDCDLPPQSSVCVRAGWGRDRHSTATCVNKRVIAPGCGIGTLVCGGDRSTGRLGFSRLPRAAAVGRRQKSADGPEKRRGRVGDARGLGAGRRNRARGGGRGGRTSWFPKLESSRELVGELPTARWGWGPGGSAQAAGTKCHGAGGGGCPKRLTLLLGLRRTVSGQGGPPPAGRSLPPPPPPAVSSRGLLFQPLRRERKTWRSQPLFPVRAPMPRPRDLD